MIPERRQIPEKSPGSSTEELPFRSLVEEEELAMDTEIERPNKAGRNM